MTLGTGIQAFASDSTEPVQTSPAARQQALSRLISTEDKRQHPRFNLQEMNTPVTLEQNSRIDKLLNISRGGIGFEHSNNVKTGDIIPVELTYKDIELIAEAKVVFSTDTQAGAEFINLDKPTANQILYLSIMLEADNDMLITRLKG